MLSRPPFGVPAMHAPPQLLLSGISVLHLIFHAYDGTNNASDDPGGEIKYIIVKTREHFHKIGWTTDCADASRVWRFVIVLLKMHAN